ncbi:MAG TPA: DUF4252 domain-containing protein [Opitutus sp.]|nr:DUF4252 domain-containing protein [Opitutus sp.]
MKSPLRVAAFALACSLVSLTARAAEPGAVDLAKFVPADGCEYVEVNLHPAVLKFASVFVDKNNPEVATLLRNLKRVRVNVVGYNDTTREDTTARITKIRDRLETEGWSKIVTARQGDKDEDVAVFVKTNNSDGIDGIVVTVLDSREKHAVFVNIVGDIKPEQLAAIGKQLNIDPLEHLHIPSERKGA